MTGCANIACVCGRSLSDNRGGAASLGERWLYKRFGVGRTRTAPPSPRCRARHRTANARLPSPPITQERGKEMRLIDADKLILSLNDDYLANCPTWNETLAAQEYRESVCEGLEIAMKTVEEAPTVSGWVSVKDRMPEKHLINDHEAYVLLYIPKRDGCSQHGIYLGFLRETPLPPDDGSGNFWNRPCPGSDWTVWEWCHFEEPKVSHWMPLPEPPKE